MVRSCPRLFQLHLERTIFPDLEDKYSFPHPENGKHNLLSATIQRVAPLAASLHPHVPAQASSSSATASPPLSSKVIAYLMRPGYGKFEDVRAN
ncbi:hypothetical protein ACFX15_034263 [Malus domestica]